MAENSEETRLLALARNGDENAFGQLVRLHELNVRRLASGLLDDTAEAEDAAQEVFVKAYRNLAKFRGDSLFSTWLHRITVNHCRDVLRKRNRRHWFSLEALSESPEREKKYASTPSDQATRGTEASDQLRSLLGGLSADYRGILLLRELSGLTYQEIAKTLDISLDAVKARLRRARQTALEVLRHSRPSGGV